VDDEDPGQPRMVTSGYGRDMFTGTLGGHATFYHPGDNPGYLSFAGWIPDRSARRARTVTPAPHRVTPQPDAISRGGTQ